MSSCKACPIRDKGKLCSHAQCNLVANSALVADTVGGDRQTGSNLIVFQFSSMNGLMDRREMAGGGGGWHAAAWEGGVLLSLHGGLAPAHPQAPAPSGL